MVKKKGWHIKVRPEYYRGNFDYDEGPYNRVNRPGDDIVDDDTMVVSDDKMQEIKSRDISKKKSQNMRMEPLSEREKYPDTSKPAPKNEIFNQDEGYYKKIYTNRSAEINKLLTEERPKLKVIEAERPKGRAKLAVIRSDKARGCPFGLPITDACENAGEAIHRLAPLESTDDEGKQESIKKANMVVYAHHKTGKQCPYADKLLKKYDKVDCDFGDTGQGQPSLPYRGSPLYPQTFQGIGLDGLYGYPLGFYADNNESRNLFFGLFSFLGAPQVEQLVKLADEYDEAGDKYRADIIDNILEKLEDVKDEEKYEDAMHKIENFLEEYRHKFDIERQDTGILYELAEKWFGPRQV